MAVSSHGGRRVQHQAGFSCPSLLCEACQGWSDLSCFSITPSSFDSQKLKVGVGVSRRFNVPRNTLGAHWAVQNNMLWWICCDCWSDWEPLHHQSSSCFLCDYNNMHYNKLVCSALNVFFRIYKGLWYSPVIVMSAVFVHNVKFLIYENFNFTSLACEQKPLLDCGQGVCLQDLTK